MDMAQLLASLQQTKHAPTERWNPPYCGPIPIHIDEHGHWHYQNSLIKRQTLVNLFASVLVHEAGEYFLVTPAEKVKITVADVPFIVTTWQLIREQDMAVIQVTTNIGQQFALSQEHPLIVRDDIPYVDCGRELWAKVHRNVLYQWSDLAQLETTANGEQYFIESAGSKFYLTSASQSS